MHFRERVRKALGRSGDNSDGSTSSSRGDASNMYAPGEPMPKPKFRAPEKEHKEKLEAFSWSTAWRRKSDQSMVSPLSSRRGSAITTGRRSTQVARPSIGQVDEVVEPDDDKENMKSQPTLAKLDSGHGDTEPNRSPGSRSPMPKSKNNAAADIGSTHAYKPFTEDELVLAMKRSNLQVPAHS